MENPMHTGAQPLSARKPGEAGSAYVAVLLVLVVLTILGLALALITQTEMQIGANERTVNRVFYATDSGIETAKVQVLVSRDFSPHTYVFSDTGAVFASGTVQFGTQVTVSNFAKVQEGPCNLCEINQAGTYNARDYAKTTYYVESSAQRFGTPDGGNTRQPVAQKLISAMFELQPFDKTIVDPNASK
jgi:Tfp pilus assembly protein PilX